MKGIAASLALALLLVPLGAGSARSEAAEPDLAGRFVPYGAQAEHGDGTPQLIRNMEVTRRGRRERALVLVAPARARAAVGDLLRAGPARLVGLAAAVYNIGDGTRLDVRIVEDGAATLVLSRTFDAARRASDRDWSPIETLVPRSVGREAFLEIELQAGPRGDLVADWLALARLELVR